MADKYTSTTDWLSGVKAVRKHHRPRTIDERLKFAVGIHSISAIHTIIQSAGAGFDINSKDDDGQLLLHTAVNSGDVEATRTLLSYGANVNSTNSIIIPCMHALQVYTKCQHPLVIAAELGNIPLVELLLSKGADPNGRITYNLHDPILGGTRVTRSIGPLHCAVLTKDREVVKVLLRHGTRTDTKDPSGNTVLHLLCDDCNCYRRYNNNGPTSPHQECSEQSGMIKLLMSSCHTSKTLNMRDATGYFPLDHVVLNGCITRVQALLDAGADPNLHDLKCFGSPLHVALCNRFYDIAEILVQNGSNLNQANLWGETPLTAHMSLFTGCSSDIMNIMLIVHGASLEVTDRYKSLIAICMRKMENGCQEMCRLLIYAGCSIEGIYWQRPFDFAQSKEGELCDWLRNRSTNPHTLMDLSRINVRKFLSEKVTNGKSIAGRVVKLPLPRLIKDHLLLSDLVAFDYHPRLHCFSQE